MTENNSHLELSWDKHKHFHHLRFRLANKDVTRKVEVFYLAAFVIMVASVLTVGFGNFPLHGVVNEVSALLAITSFTLMATPIVLLGMLIALTVMLGGITILFGTPSRVEPETDTLD